MVVPRAICVLLCLVLCVSYAYASEESWPATLLEHTAIASQQWAPTPRNRLEKLQLTQTPRLPQFLGAQNQQVLFFGDDARGGASDTAGNQRENNGRAREPQSDHFEEGHGAAGQQASYAGLPLPSPRAPRSACNKAGGCGKGKGPEKPAPLVVPPPPFPVGPATPVKPAPPNKADYPKPPPPENPLPTPPTPTCVGLCNPDASKDPLLARVAGPPLDDITVAAVGAEADVLRKIVKKLRNREGWLRAQKTWLSKAVEAAATVRREIELAEFTKDAVASDLEQLKLAQDNLSIKYKADRLKWSFKDKKITMQALKERLEELEHAKADVAHQIRSAKDEVTILESTLGPPSQQVQISPAELEDPLKFLEDVTVPEEY